MFSSHGSNNSALTALLAGQHMGGNAYAQPQTQFPVQPQASMQSRRTSVHDLEALLTSLPEDEYAAVVSDPAFQEESQRLKGGFLSWLLSGEIGTAYVESGAKGQAERVLIAAKNAHAKATEKTRADMEAMRARLAELENLLQQKSGGVTDAK